MRMSIGRIAAAAFLTVAMQAGGARAAPACGDVPTPCTVEEGVYHAAAPAGAGPHGAVVFLHGWGGRGEGILRNRGLVEAVTGRGYALIAPQGMPRRPGDRGGSWNVRRNPRGRDDIAFLASVAADAAARFDLDPARIVLAGFSAGGMMTWRVACSAPDTFAAYAPIAGLLWRPLPAACDGPVRLHHTHGWSDPVVPLEGRIVGSGIEQGDLFAGLALLRAAAGCESDAPDGYGAEAAYRLRRWEGCRPGAALEMALHPGGHVIPRGWSALALDWFERVAGQASE